MSLEDRKIPIIVGRNNIPTVSIEQPHHPNGSFIIKQYNDLIDNELKTLFPPTTSHPEGLEIYVDSDQGNDANNGTSANPLATIEQALKIASSKKIQSPLYIRLSGTFTNPFFDFSKCYSERNSFKVIHITDTPNKPFPTIVYTQDTTLTNAINTRVIFKNIVFELGRALDCMATIAFIWFDRCQFKGLPSNEDVLVYLTNTTLFHCEFYKNNSNVWTGIFAIDGNVYFQGVTSFFGFGTGVHLATETNTYIYGSYSTDSTMSIECLGGILGLPYNGSFDDITYLGDFGIAILNNRILKNTYSNISNIPSGTDLNLVINKINIILEALRMYGVIRE